MAEKLPPGARAVQLFRLPQELNDCVYTSEKYPLLIDPTGQGAQFLKYRARFLSKLKKGDFEKESLRKGLVQALHNGATMCLDFDITDIDILEMFDKDNFPEEVINPHALFVEEVYNPLLRATDKLAAKVTYEHNAALAEGAFQDRTKSHAPERCADVDNSFDPKEAFRLVVTTRKEEIPLELQEKFCVLYVQCTQEQVDNNAGTWAGGSRPKEEKSKDQMQMDTDLLEFAFDGEVDEVKKLLDKGADTSVVDGRGNSALSEAAVKGHIEVVRVLLDWKAPIGSDPNSSGSDKRTPLHRAAFGGFTETVQLLLERGADPRLKDKQGDLAFDFDSNPETSAALAAWDVAKTDKLKAERLVAIDKDDEEHVKNDEERQQLAKRKKMKTLSEYAEAGEKDLLELELMDLDRSTIGTYRDDRGNTLLHIACIYGKVDCLVMLIDEMGVHVDSRDSKGWTPIAVAAFHGQKMACRELMGRKADPTIKNSYHKDACEVAKDDEIKEVLTNPSLALGPGADALNGERPETPAELLESLEAADACPKAKAKAKPKGLFPASAAKAKAEAGAAPAAKRASVKAKAKAKH